MKNSTKFLAFACALGVAYSAQADAAFTASTVVPPDTHRTGATAGDFTNNDKMDIFFRGQYSRAFEKPGIWAWTSQATMMFNEGDDVWNIDGLTAVQNAEPNKDENGETVVDEEGNPVYNWHLEGNHHGIRCAGYDQSACIDYNCDGLLDLLVFGEDGSDDWFCSDELKKNHLSLYRNNGDGTFTLVEEAAFPVVKPQKSFKSNGLTVADYDRDGYPDFIANGFYTDPMEDPTLTDDYMVLYHNEGGTGVFTRQDIAKTKNPVYSQSVKDEEGNEVVAPRVLEGWFRPINGNVFFADLNNDGWVDIINVGWFTSNEGAVYLNKEGKEFVEVTPEIFDTLRNGSGAVNDFDGDGYLDFFHIGWGDNGYNWNAFLYTNTADGENVFDTFSDATALGVWGDEDRRIHVRDFDNDGNLDIMYSQKDNKISICYGDAMGVFTAKQHDEYFEPGAGCVADFNNDGLSDVYYAGEWGDDYFAGKLYYNATEVPVTAPAAPANVAVNYADGKLTVTWDDVEGSEAARLAYNVVVKGADGKIYAMLPANLETGFVKVANGREVAVRPGVGEYSIALPEASYTVGVQTVCLANESYSPFTTAELAGIDAVTAEAPAFGVAADAEGLTVAGNGEAVKVYNALGQAVAEGVAGEKIAVAAKGILVVTKGNDAVKVVK